MAGEASREPVSIEQAPPAGSSREEQNGALIAPFFVIGLAVMGGVALIGSGIGIDPWTGVVTFIGSILAVAVILWLVRAERPG